MSLGVCDNRLVYTGTGASVWLVCLEALYAIFLDQQPPLGGDSIS